MSEFGSLNLEEMLGEDSRLNSQGGQNNFLDQFVPMPDVKPGQTGSVTVRILPPAKGGKLFQFNRVHTLNERKIHCPRPLVNGKWDYKVNCPICDYYSSLWKQIDKLEKAGQINEVDKLKEEARSIKPIERYYYNAIVRNLVIDGETKNNVGPRILSVGKGLHKVIVQAIVGVEGDPDSKLGNITDLKAGYDFIVRKEVTAGDGYPKYDRTGFARSPSIAGSMEEIEQWVTGLHDLSKLRNPKGVEDLEKELAIHRGLIPDEVEDFKAENFDRKWRQKAGEEVNEILNHNPGAVNGVDMQNGKIVDDVEASDVDVSEQIDQLADMAIGDDDFLKKLGAVE